MTTDTRIWAVVLAGGVGSRFWPVSTPRRPKQLLPLASEQPLITETAERILPLVPRERLRILTGRALVEPLASALPGFTEENFLVEPRAAGTAPVLAWAAAEIERQDPDAVMISLHADHVIEPPEAFRATLAEAAALALRHDRLFTIGASPDRPETGFGYIRAGAPLGEGRGREVDAFVEKPDADTARRYLDSGEYLWNTGIFVFPVRRFLAEIESHTPEIARWLPELRRGDAEAFFAGVESLSVDEGILERSQRVGVVPCDFRWDDVGAWDAVHRVRRLDETGNAVVGDGHAVETSGSVIYAEDGPVVTYGVDDLIVVRTAGVTFVARRSHASRLKELIARLPDRLVNLD
jgi:mannose-1-phosphate guanylyltransferase